MSSKMLIDASHPEETRVVVTKGDKIEQFDFESENKKPISSNVYLAKIIRIEPSLQAAFVDFGGNKHGFLAFSEIHPGYYRIPVADREALLADEIRTASEMDEGKETVASSEKEKSEALENRAADSVVRESLPNSDEESEGEARKAGVRRRSRRRGQKKSVVSEENSGDNGEDALDADVILEQAGVSDVMEEVAPRSRLPQRNYKIQEVIRKRQVVLVQVVKEERGNKGAALTTYISLAGRYSVLMPNLARGGGISRKITSAADRARLKTIVKDLEIPEGMGVILRTAGANRTKSEIKKDFEYLLRLWEQVRELTLSSVAPTLVYEEGSLIKRAIRDLYVKEIEEIRVAGEEGYRLAKEYMRMMSPSYARVVKLHKESEPIFATLGVEAQLDSLFSNVVSLKSGGYLVINTTEALVSIDVNSGRATQEYNIEDTALRTNVEAAEEIARQLRLRDLAGIIVIDFIDMDEKRNNRTVERRIAACLKSDRARIQMGRISHFGLLEMSRQRTRTGVLESSTVPCAQCAGLGFHRSTSSIVLGLLRAVEKEIPNNSKTDVILSASSEVLLYILNCKRSVLDLYEKRFGGSFSFQPDETFTPPRYFSITQRPQIKKLEEEPVAQVSDDAENETKKTTGRRGKLSSSALKEKQNGAWKSESNENDEKRNDGDEQERNSPESSENAEALPPETNAAASSDTEPKNEVRSRRRRSRRRRGGEEKSASSSGTNVDSAPPESPDIAETNDALQFNRRRSDFVPVESKERTPSLPSDVAATDDALQFKRHPSEFVPAESSDKPPPAASDVVAAAEEAPAFEARRSNSVEFADEVVPKAASEGVAVSDDSPPKLRRFEPASLSSMIKKTLERKSLSFEENEEASETNAAENEKEAQKRTGWWGTFTGKR